MLGKSYVVYIYNDVVRKYVLLVMDLNSLLKLFFKIEDVIKIIEYIKIVL